VKGTLTVFFAGCIQRSPSLFPFFLGKKEKVKFKITIHTHHGLEVDPTVSLDSVINLVAAIIVLIAAL